jgi:hypothetical protein
MSVEIFFYHLLPYHHHAIHGYGFPYHPNSPCRHHQVNQEEFSSLARSALALSKEHQSPGLPRWLFAGAAHAGGIINS